MMKIVNNNNNAEFKPAPSQQPVGDHVYIFSMDFWFLFCFDDNAKVNAESTQN